MGNYMSEEEEKIFFEILKELGEYFNTKEEKEILKEINMIYLVNMV